MRTAAVIENGKVVNVITISEGTDGDVTLQELSAIEIGSDNVRIGDAFDGQNFTRIKTDEELLAEQEAAKKLERRLTIAAKLGLDENDLAALFGE